MRPAATLFHITAAVVFLQVLIGGLVVLGYIDTGVHVDVGYLTLVLAVVTLSGVGLARPRYKPALAISVLLVLLIVVQGALGFAWLDSKNDGLIAAHFVNAMVIYGLSVAGAFAAVRWGRMAAEPGPGAPQ